MKTDHHDDDLMAATARGEEAAYRLLVERWQPDLRRFLQHMLGSPEEAADALQDTLVQVYRQADRYRPQGLFRSWLFRIAGNQARSRLRRRRIIGWIRFDTQRHDSPAADPDALAEMVREERSRAVHDAVAQLPPRQREALVLHRFQGLRYAEVAEAMDTTVPGVESLIQRAMAALRTRLERKDDRP